MALGRCGLAGAFRVGLWDLSWPGCKAFLAYMLMNIAKSETTYSVAVLQCAAQTLPLLPISHPKQQVPGEHHGLGTGELSASTQLSSHRLGMAWPLR